VLRFEQTDFGLGNSFWGVANQGSSQPYKLRRSMNCPALRRAFSLSRLVFGFDRGHGITIGVA